MIFAGKQTSPSCCYIKNALIKGDAGTAAVQADEFVKAINSIDMKVISDTDMKAFIPLQEKLSLDAKNIADTKEIGRQRNYFKSFSDNFYKLAKSVKLSKQPVYQAYCPICTI